MLKTYNALLHGSRLDWLDEVPDDAITTKPAKVHVTFLDHIVSASENDRGAHMARILDQIANRGTAFQDVDDPATWQKEIRRDRPLLR